MGHSRSKLDPRALLGVLVIALVASAFWAASAFAAGGSSSSDQSQRESPPAAFAQSDGDAPDSDDCPEHDRESGDGDSSLGSSA